MSEMTALYGRAFEVIVPGNAEYRGTCITDTANRHDPSHCWGRAAIHIMHFKELNFFERMEAATACAKMVEAILAEPRPPVRWGVKWGWGKGWPEQ